LGTFKFAQSGEIIAKKHGGGGVRAKEYKLQKLSPLGQ
jgi:hypothetical protein